MARWSDDGATVHVWSHSQGIHALRRAIAAALPLDPSAVSVEHVENAGCYGHNAADDAAFDAVLLARTVPGRPVLLRWTRRDELTWGPLSPAMTSTVSARLVDGRIEGWSYDVWSQGHTSRPGYAGQPGLLAMAHRRRRQLPCHLRPTRPRPPDSAASATPYLSTTSAAAGSPGTASPRRRCARSAMRALGCVPQRVRDRVVHGRAGRRRRPRPGRLPTRPPRRPPRPGGRRAGRARVRLGRAAGRLDRPRRRLRPLQGERRVVRGRRGGRGRDRGPGPTADRRRRPRAGDQPRRCPQPAVRRRRAGDQLDDASSGSASTGAGSPATTGRATRSCGSPRRHASTYTSSTATSRRSAPVRPPRDPPRPRSRTPSTPRSAYASATCP